MPERPEKNDKRDRDLDRELRDHLELDAEAKQDRGMSADEARFAAQREFGNATRVKEVTREMWGWASLERFWQDVRYSLRLMRRNPGFTAVAVLTLALGIGANTAIFSIVNAVFLRPIPLPDAGRIFVVHRVNNQIGGNSLSFPVYLAWQDNRDAFEAFGLLGFTGNTTMTGKGEPERISSLGATSELFSVFGVQPAMGRAFRPEECRPGGPKLAILSDALWRRKFSADPNILGQAIAIGGVPRTIVGVMPREFEVPLGSARDVQIWVPYAVPLASENPSNGGMMCFGRLRKGVAAARAEAALTPTLGPLREKFPKMFGAGEAVRLDSIRKFISAGAGTAPLLLFGAVGFVLLIACANVANLFLARSASRQREVAIRTALGASRGRLLRQLLTESVLLAFLGGIAGVLVCYASFQSVLSLVPSNLPHIGQFRLDGNVFVFALILSVLTGIVFGLVPALETSAADPQKTLKEGSAGAGASRRRGYVRSALVVAEVGVSLVLLVGAALTLESLSGLLHVPTGFETHNTVVFGLGLPQARAKTSAEINSFLEQFNAKLSALPGVQKVAYANALPFLGGPDLLYSVEGRSASKDGDSHDSAYRVVSSDYFSAMHIPLVRGRIFLQTDAANSEPVAVINRAMADEVFPKEDPIGQHIWIGKPMGPENSEAAPRRIVGVVENIREYSLAEPAYATMYAPYSQTRDGDARSALFIVHSAQDPMSLVPAMRAALGSLAPDLPPSRVRTMEDVVSTSLVDRRFSTTLLALFGAMALLIATVGVYGVISYSVAQRTHEIGIRVALGASRGRVMGMVLGQGLRLAAAGIAAGLVASYWLTKLLSDLLYDVKPTDPATFAGVSLALIGVALAACWIPARRATRVDPIVALRYE
jgi:putative ABC transport system permease protein